MNGVNRRYWKAACIERCTCSLGEGSQKSVLAVGQLVGFLSYVESHFNIVRKMADAKFARARSWEELIATHRAWMRDYNTQRHWAHEKREDGCHSPAAVLGDQKGTVYPESVLNRILFATRYTRHLNRFGYLRVQGWKLYGERALPGEPVTVWIYGGRVTVEYQTVTLSKYDIEVTPDRKQITQVSNSRRVAHPFRSPQLTLIDVSPSEWRLYWRAPSYVPRRRQNHTSGIVQLPLFDPELVNDIRSEQVLPSDVSTCPPI